MSDIFEEVNEGLRQERAHALWKNWGPFVMGGAALIIAGVAALEYLQWSRDQRIEKQARTFAEALDLAQKGDAAAAAAEFETLSKASGGYAALSNIKLADVALADPAKADVAATRLSAASDKEKGPIGDLALLKLAYLKADTADAGELKNMVQPLIEDGGGVSVLARELLAAKAFAAGDLSAAKTEYQVLSLDIDAPAGVVQRSRQALAMIHAKEAEKTSAAAPANETQAKP